MKSFEDLDCWKKIMALRRRLEEIVKTFPREEKFRLVDQIIRASRSASANIAEGYGRYHYQEYNQFYRQSRGSLYELIDHLIVARDNEYISTILFNELRTEIETCLAVLNGFINYLVKAKSRNLVNEPETDYSNNPIDDTDSDKRITTNGNDQAHHRRH